MYCWPRHVACNFLRQRQGAGQPAAGSAARVLLGWREAAANHTGTMAGPGNGDADAAAAVPFRLPPPFAGTAPHCTAEYCINERGYKIVQLWQEIPALAPLYTEFETGERPPASC